MITISTLFKIPTSPIKISKKSNHKLIIPADLWPRGVAVLDERLDTDLDLNLESRLGILDEAALLEVLAALLLLLRLEVGRVGGVAALGVAVVALDVVVVLGLLNHHNLGGIGGMRLKICHILTINN